MRLRDDRSRRERVGNGRLDDRSGHGGADADSDSYVDAHAGAQPGANAHADSDARAREHPRADGRDRQSDDATRSAERPGPAVR